jgi:hypothetical protein
MRPYKLINVGDVYQRYGQGIFWTVVSKDDDSKMIEIRSDYQHPALPPTLWKKCSDNIFNRKIN